MAEVSDHVLQTDVAAGVATLTLDRPDAGNAIDLQLARELADVTARWSTRSDVRVVLVRGNGPRFCVGGDLRAFAQQDDLPTHLTEVTAHLHAAMARLARMPAPVVAAVQGSAAGAGFSLACAADIVLAGASSRFVLAYGAIGLTPDGSATWYLPRVVGLRRALELALTNRVLDAAEAERIGLVSRVVPDEALDDEARALVGALAQGPAGALAATKRLLRGSLERPLEAQLELETESLARAAASPDGREGIAAFLGKRPPHFEEPGA
jgi:2-(1,2-epoxy-1,2-dihydrophenyl)acetyl-CoA isomerase